MSKVRNKYLKRAFILTKKDKSKCRKEAILYPKSNIRYCINNFGFKIGVNNKFVMQST